tara:strand:+ start:187 stop:672 length:486 start_codon:yes stop_codon:yes gene_type:complete
MNSYVHQLNYKVKTAKEVGMPKQSINEALVIFKGIEGDFNRFRFLKKHNDPDMALMIISMDILERLNREGWPVKPGDLGENLTLGEFNYDTLKPGNCYKVGTVELKISFICDPCGNLGTLDYVGESKKKSFIKTLLGRRGWYARVTKEGVIKKRDSFKLIS